MKCPTKTLMRCIPLILCTWAGQLAAQDAQTDQAKSAVVNIASGPVQGVMLDAATDPPALPCVASVLSFIVD